MPKLFVTGDLHFFVTADEAIRAMFDELVARAGESDVLLVLGDLASAPVSAEQAILRGFEHVQCFPGTRLFAVGNHDIGVDPAAADGRNQSLRRYEEWIPVQASRLGIHVLDTGPVEVGGTVFVGGIGPIGSWAESLGGAPSGWLREFLDIPDRDGFDRANLARLEEWLGQAGDRPVVAGFHVPPKSASSNSIFWPVLERSRPKRIYCGHLHRDPGIKGIRFVGSDYCKPRYLVVDLP